MHVRHVRSLSHLYGLISTPILPLLLTFLTMRQLFLCVGNNAPSEFLQACQKRAREHRIAPRQDDVCTLDPGAAGGQSRARTKKKERLIVSLARRGNRTRAFVVRAAQQPLLLLLACTTTVSETGTGGLASQDHRGVLLARA